MRIDLTIRQTSGLNEASEDSHHDRGRSICLDILFESSSYACNHARPFSNQFHSHPVAMYNTCEHTCIVHSCRLRHTTLHQNRRALYPIHPWPLAYQRTANKSTNAVQMHFYTAFEFMGLNIGTVLSNSTKFTKPFVT